jgi:hypothetical protein
MIYSLKLKNLVNNVVLIISASDNSLSDIKIKGGNHEEEHQKA